MSDSSVPLRVQDFDSWDDYYWSYQRRLADEALLPTLRSWGLWREGIRVLDVGCGNGGASCGLAAAGATVEGIELDPRRLEDARRRATSLGLDLRLTSADITRPSTLEGFEGPYGLILFRDVLEHIPDAAAALASSVARLAPGGAIVVTYPPYWSAYGGHQQILAARRRLGLRWAKLPFAHWLPAGGLRWLAGVEPDDANWREILTLRRARLTVGKLHRLARAAGLVVPHGRGYLLRPSYRLRYGTPVLGAGPLLAIPGLREVVVTGVAFALTRHAEVADGREPG